MTYLACKPVMIRTMGAEVGTCNNRIHRGKGAWRRGINVVYGNTYPVLRGMRYPRLCGIHDSKNDYECRQELEIVSHRAARTSAVSDELRTGPQQGVLLLSRWMADIFWALAQGHQNASTCERR